MFCRKCGSKLNDSDKFCGKCGTKVNGKKINTEKENKIQNNSNLDSFISNITTAQGGVSESYNESNNNDKNLLLTSLSNDKVKKKSIKRKKTKVVKKKKLKAKPKNRVNNKKKRNSKNVKKTIILVAAILSVLLVASSIFIMIRKDSLFAKKDVLKAMMKTISQVSDGYLQTDIVKKLGLDTYDKNKSTEMYLKIDEASGGLINDDVFSSLEGISLTTEEIYNGNDESEAIKLILDNGRGEKINATIYELDGNIICSIPNIYDKSFGLSLSETKDTRYNDCYFKMKDITQTILNSKKSIHNSRHAFKEYTFQLCNTIIEGCDLQFDSKDKETKTKIYNATIENKIFVDNLVTYFNLISNDEDIVNFISYLLYSTGIHDSLNLADADYKKQIGKIVKSLNEALENEKFSDTQIEIITENDIIKELNLENTINDMNFNTKLTTAKINDKLNLNAKIDLSKDDREICLSFENSIKDGDDKFSNTTNCKFSIGDMVYIFWDVNSEYNFNNKNYISDSKIVYKTPYDYNEFEFCIDGQSKEENTSDDNRIVFEINKLSANAVTSFYKFNVNLSGYMKESDKILQDDIYDANSILFVDKIIGEDVEVFKKELYNNTRKFIKDFENYSW